MNQSIRNNVTDDLQLVLKHNKVLMYNINKHTILCSYSVGFLQVPPSQFARPLLPSGVEAYGGLLGVLSYFQIIIRTTQKVCGLKRKIV